jgi:modification methylase
VLLSATNPGDLVLDPFFGTGTTGAVAKRLGRHFVGIERDPAYVKAAAERIATVQPLPAELLMQPIAKREEPRVAFASLVETSRIAPGTVLTDAKSRHAAIVRPDGQLDANGIVGSIHKIGALVQGLPACNGWTFWHIEIAGRHQPIDILRAEIRAAQKAA